MPRPGVVVGGIVNRQKAQRQTGELDKSIRESDRLRQEEEAMLKKANHQKLIDLLRSNGP